MLTKEDKRMARMFARRIFQFVYRDIEANERINSIMPKELLTDERRSRRSDDAQYLFGSSDLPTR